MRLAMARSLERAPEGYEAVCWQSAVYRLHWLDDPCLTRNLFSMLSRTRR